MEITPDRIVYWQKGWVSLNATLLFTWGIMALLVLVSWLVTRNLSTGPALSRWQNFLEVLVLGIRDQIREVSHYNEMKYLPFIGTLFLFVATSNLLSVVPGFSPPTGSLSTTVGLAISVLLAVPLYGIAESGFAGYLKNYIRPSVFMLPFNIIGELSRTLALAVRLFGNIMSGSMLAAILLAIAPLFLPILMHVLSLLTGLIQAYIFSILALVYIASGAEVHEELKSQIKDV